ncbi:MAG: dethiobiotin synthase [Acetobacter papayae]|uniref:dethiobiotin synthase n=1 Tax=Acetobacter papayae TaxID=1076592 RepID=UPI0039E94133
MTGSLTGETPQPATLRQAHIRDRFDGAQGYDGAATLQRVAARTLADDLALTMAERAHTPLRVLEIGCGTGFLSVQLCALWPQAHILATDYAPQMLERVRARLGARVDVRLMDAARPDIGGPFDVICGNLVLQWLDNPAEALNRLTGLLAPGGVLAVSTLRAGTFAEWQTACEQEGQRPATPAYPDMAALARWVPYPCQGVWRAERCVQAFGTGLDFVRHLKATGANTPRADASGMSAGALRRVATRFEESGAAVTWELAYGCFRRPARAGVFVTGTDTGVGKTLVSACLVRRWQALYWKPLQSGLADEEGDTPTVSRLAGGESTQGQGVRCFPPAGAYQASLSPEAAARAEGVTIDPALLALPMEAPQQPLVVEGAGGLMVPVTDEIMMVDLAQRWGLPVVLVARSGLGTLNHTLLSLEALRARGIAVAGVVLNGPPNPENSRTIADKGKVRILAEIPHEAGLDAPTVERLAALLPAWSEIAGA